MCVNATCCLQPAGPGESALQHLNIKDVCLAPGLLGPVGTALKLSLAWLASSNLKTDITRATSEGRHHLDLPFSYPIVASYHAYSLSITYGLIKPSLLILLLSLSHVASTLKQPVAVREKTMFRYATFHYVSHVNTRKID